MIKKLLSVIVIVAVGVVVARRVREHSGESVAPPAAAPRRIPAETLEVRTEAAPQGERHALRPSPVPREHPVWSPPVDGTSAGKHAVREDDTRGADDSVGDSAPDR